MKKPKYIDISIFIVNRIFNWRFWIAELTKKSKLAKKIIDKMLFEDDEIVIVPNTINIDKKIESEGSEFLPTDVLKDVIKRSEDIVIMDKCLCRTSNDCQDYPQDIGCIFLGPTSRKIPNHVAHKATVEEALDQIDRADATGLSHLIGRNKIDAVWMNIHPGKGLLTICHCCPCCCLWKVYPNLNNEISDKIERLDGVNVKLHEEKCKKCLKCLDNICMFNAINLINNKISIDYDNCKGCGLCVNTCSFNAITINYIEESIDNIVNRMENLIEIEEI